MLEIVESLAAALGKDRVITEGALLQERRHDYWVLSHLDDIQNRAAPPPACVVQPQSVDDVVNVVNICREGHAALIPFGLGSGVCGGVVANMNAVLIDLSTMNQTHFIDETNLVASFGAGKNGGEAERDVAAKGLTIGHWPQSIDVSSVGGWIATRASGQFSTAYGNIEEIVYSIEAVLPNGEVITTGKAPRASAGPDLRHLLIGSEGTLGVITNVTLSLRRAPEKQAHTSYIIGDMASGFELQRAIIQAGWQPPVMRQYDATEAQRNFPEANSGENALILMVHEGPAARVDVEAAAINDLAQQHNATPAPAGVVASWLDHRNNVPKWGQFLEGGIILDTIEVSAPWTMIHDIYSDAVKRLKEVPGMLAASAHSSHVYRTGLNLYFTFAAQPSAPEKMADTYRECWRHVLEATADHGGGIAHHHGIGRVRKDFLVHDIGEIGVNTLRAVKDALDPQGFMNPGVLLPNA